MVENMILQLTRFVLLSGLLLAAKAGSAQLLSDPTRPPEVNDAGVATAHSVADGPVLQAVVLERDRKFALISGQTVRLGGKYDGATLTQISESQVTLRSGKGTKVLKLIPGIDKKTGNTARPPPARAGTGSGSKGVAP